MPRNSPKQAIRNKKCRSRILPEPTGQATLSGRSMTRRQFAYRHAAVLNTVVLAQHYAPTGGR